MAAAPESAEPRRRPVGGRGGGESRARRREIGFVALGKVYSIESRNTWRLCRRIAAAPSRGIIVVRRPEWGSSCAVCRLRA